MKAKTLVRVAGKSILKNKMRTLLTMLGIIIGVGAVMLMVAIGSGAQRQIQERILTLGTNMIVVTAGSTSAGGVSQGAQSFNRLTIDDADRMRSQSFLLSGISPVILTRTQAIGGAGNWRTFIFGVHPDYQTIRNWQLQSGVFFEQQDLRSMRKVAVLGSTVAENLFPDEDPIGQQIQLRDVPFQIVGVLTPKGQTAGGTDQDDVILVPYTTAQARLSGHMFIAQILASTFSPEEIPAAQEEIRQIMRDSHELGDSESDDFTVRNQGDLADAAQETTKVMTLLLSAIASISLLVGGIGIMNIMLVSVTERTREIGLRLALGARGSDVLTQFLVESVVMSLAGGLIGVAVGFGGGALLGAITGWRTMIAPGTVFLALGFAAVVGIFFGYYPARRAASLNPIEALRYE
ncbi:MAG: ABC transporter permease [Candidatus Eisenbacteria bacterium]